MKIETIWVDGFGHFHDRSLRAFGPGLNVVYGPNEAGKSTLLAFVRTMLYGFPRRNRGHHYPPLRGGNHGGRLVLLDHDGGRYVLERTAGARGGEVRLRLPAGDYQEDGAVLQRLLGGATQGVFESVFAFSLAELEHLESLTADEVGAQIYSAGLGASRVPEALRRLEQEQGDLYKPRGSKSRVATLVRDLEALEARIRERSTDEARYGELQSRLAALEGEIEEAGAEIARLQNETARVRQLQSAWPEWTRAVTLREDLDALPDRDLPANASARLEKLETLLDELSDALDTARREYDRATRAREAIVLDDAALDHAEAIRKLARYIGSFEASMRDLPKRQAEATVARAALDDAVAELGPGWTLELARAVDTSTAAREAIAAHRERLEAASRLLFEHEKSLETVRRSLAAAETDLAREESARDRLPEPTMSREALEERRCLLDRCRGAQDALLTHPIVEVRRASRVLPALAGGSMAALLGLVLLGPVGVIAGAALGGIAGWIVASVWSSAGSGTADPGAAARDDFERSLAEAGITAAELSSAERELDQESARINEYDRATARVRTAAEALEDAQRLVETTSEETARAKERLIATQQAWQDEAAARGLPASATPEQGIVLWGQARDVAARAMAITEIERRIQGIERDIDDFVALVRETARACGEPGDIGPDTAAAVAGRLTARLEAAKAARADARAAEERQALAAEQCETVEQRLSAQEAALRALLDSAGAADVDTLRAYIYAAETRRAIEAELRECELRLRQVIGAGESLEEFGYELEQHGPAELEASLAELEARLRETRDQRDTLVEERGGLQRERQELQRSGELSALLAERESLRADLQELAMEWAEVRTARWLIERARAQYEQEHQPRVIQAAGGYFAAMTGGRYTRLIAPLGEQVVMVVEDDAAPKRPEQLSRGTREQLYLALRFGLIEQFAERGAALPVLVDEVLVNCDPERAAAVVRGFAALASRHQVISFTCHPWVVDLFRAANGDTVVVDLESQARPIELATARRA